VRLSKDAWILVGLFVALCVGGYFAARPQLRPEIKQSSSWNPDPNGVKAFYTLLGEKLGYSVSRLQAPYTELPTRARMLIVVQPVLHSERPKSALTLPETPRIEFDEQDALYEWVREGGVVVFFADGLEGVPDQFASTRTLGKGSIYAYDSKDVVTNRGLRDYKNAVKALDVIARHAGKRDLILFDEYHHGAREEQSLTDLVGRQAWIAIAMIALAAGVFCYSRARRFGAVRGLPSSETLRPGYEFVESVGRLYQKAHATDLALGILCDSFKHSLCARLGMAADSPRDLIAARLMADISPDVASRVDRLLAECEAHTAGDRPSEAELLVAARRIHQLEKELGLGIIDG